jgi:hypothetical protein
MSNRGIRLTPLTHLLHFKDEERKPLRVTTKQVEAWMAAKSKNATLVLEDEWFGTQMYCGDPWAFKEATEIKPAAKYRWVCDYRNRHDLNQPCDCLEKYGVPYWKHLENVKIRIP